MKKSRILTCTGIGAAGMIFLSACTSQISTPIPDVVKIQNVSEAGDGRVTVSSREIVKVVPDMGEITFWVETENKDASACQQENAEKVNGLVDFLKGQGFEEKSVSTSGFSLDPKYDWSSNRQTLIGYTMQTRVSLTDIPMDQIGGLISQGVAAGATGIGQVNYFASKYDEAYQQALEQAVVTAKAKAETLAHADGMQLAEILKIEEVGDSQTGRYVNSGISRNQVEMAAMASDKQAMMVSPGEMEVSAQITVDFSLLPR